ncbi:glutaredoxin family protein [Microbacterium maritypicum]
MTTITILSQAACSSCEQAKAVIARVAQEHSLHIDEVPIDSAEGQILTARHGVVFAPGILIDGNMFSYGRLSEKKLRRHLAQHASSTDITLPE